MVYFGALPLPPLKCILRYACSTFTYTKLECSSPVVCLGLFEQGLHMLSERCTLLGMQLPWNINGVAKLTPLPVVPFYFLNLILVVKEISFLCYFVLVHLVSILLFTHFTVLSDTKKYSCNKLYVPIHTSAIGSFKLA